MSGGDEGKIGNFQKTIRGILGISANLNTLGVDQK